MCTGFENNIGTCQKKNLQYLFFFGWVLFFTLGYTVLNWVASLVPPSIVARMLISCLTFVAVFILVAPRSYIQRPIEG